MEIVSGNDVLMVSPIMVLLFTGVVLMLLDAFKQYKPLPWVAAIGILGILCDGTAACSGRFGRYP